MTILVIDGQGGKLGRSLIESIKKAVPRVDIVAVGTNSMASNNMQRGGADRVATGENAVKVACGSADIIAGPLGIAVAGALLGEISAEMATAVSLSNACRILLPMNLHNTYIAGVGQSSAVIMEDALAHVRQLVEKAEKTDK